MHLLYVYCFKTWTMSMIIPSGTQLYVAHQVLSCSGVVESSAFSTHNFLRNVLEIALP